MFLSANPFASISNSSQSHFSGSVELIENICNLDSRVSFSHFWCMILGKSYKRKLIFFSNEEDDINACFTRFATITGVKMLCKLSSTTQVGQAPGPLWALGWNQLTSTLIVSLVQAISGTSFSSFSFLRPFSFSRFF